MSTRPRCARCQQFITIDTDADEDLWAEVIGERFGPGYICAGCFTRAADERLIDWVDRVRFVPLSLAGHRRAASPVTASEQQAVPVAQEQESALATAFCLLDTFAGEGLGHTYGNGQQIDADTTVHALCSAFYMEPNVGWYRDLAAELAPASLPCKSGEGAGEDKGNHDCLAKRRPGEPMFILLGRDPDAWQIVRAWAARRLNAGGDPEHSLQGMKTANAMREYAADPANRPASAPDAGAYPRLDATQTREAGESDGLTRRVAEVVNEDGGCWTACSGCQESDEGYVSEKYYPYSPIFKCQPGGGCRECGGIGVLWQDGAFLVSYGLALSEDATQTREAEGVSVAEYNEVYDKFEEVVGGAFRDGFQEGWVFALTPDGTDYDDRQEEYGRTVDIEPSEAWEGYRDKYEAMLPVAALPVINARGGA
ncbi:hypothetical protein C8J45_102222 [Sphingomonas sp. PP-CE-3G-477]|uniref:hypothetical protein n=1 Tax=Sphingomonas sp. PP-CE-3G-477 TaxID=2135660 RepID=UPI000D34FDCA|nr:hypothetical protein [Sphingomonas sp. PP-CE-3G-477]PTQ64866.1 hypothetical protein C8J45_102222 [Sphingomonas sp. PP-CE-3G-477]